MLAKDIMTHEVIMVSPEENVNSVMKMLIDNKISGVPVVDEEKHLLGVVTEKDLMIKAKELKVPFYLTVFDSIIYLENPNKFKEEMKKYTGSRVKDVMTTRVVTAEEDTAVSDIVELFTEYNINRVPIVRRGKVIGIVTRNDVLKALVKK
ncbi:MAG: CBS domain-containing protein [Methylocystaceae bacterium]